MNIFSRAVTVAEVKVVRARVFTTEPETANDREPSRYRLKPKPRTAEDKVTCNANKKSRSVIIAQGHRRRRGSSQSQNISTQQILAGSTDPTHRPHFGSVSIWTLSRVSYTSKKINIKTMR